MNRGCGEVVWRGLEADLGSPEKEWERKGSSEEDKTEQKAGADCEVKVGDHRSRK